MSEFTIPQQTVTDKVSGLILKFWVDADGFSRLSVWSGNIPLMNRDFGFEKNVPGVAFTGTAMGGSGETTSD